MSSKKFFILLSLYYFLFFTLIGDYVIFLPKYFTQIGFSPTQIGIIFSIMPIARFITPFLYLKKPITKKNYILSLIISTFASFLLLSNNFYLILIAFFLIGSSFAIVFPYIEAIAIEKLKEKYGLARVYGSIGFMLFGIIFSYISGNLIYLFIILMILTNLIALFLKEDKKISKKVSSINFKKEWKFWIAVILLQISFGGFYNFFTIYNLQHGISKEYIGWLWAIGVIAEIVIFIIGHKFLQKLSSKTWIKIAIFLTSIRWLMVYLFAGNLLLIAISQIIHAFSFAIFHTSALLYLSNRYENKTLAQQFYSGIAYGLAAFLGSLISGYLYGEKLFLYESFIALIGFLVML
ncbi:MFS transporter [Caminibacter mediatlanticus TB-2]|uniref:MFS transporter n=1 Tax=Caminibacter mediatlanticus TB-2 TaxID=391592 RepID=A0ABX5V9Q4_9BACT|nr:MFS transporter [Caminibacter mediatlanticus TB-2]